MIFEDALCAQLPKKRAIAIFFDDKNVDVAKGYCRQCPALAACVVAGLDEPFGVWGGLTVDERELVRRRRERQGSWR